MRCRGLLWIWSDRVPGAPADVAASAAFTDESGTVDFDAKFPDELEADFTKTEPAALGASALG